MAVGACTCVQGATTSHADVVVGSGGAVLLSLALPDFLQAFKGILGLRQQVRRSRCGGPCSGRAHSPLVRWPFQRV